MTRTSEGKLQAGMPVDTQAIPVKLGDRVIAVVEQHTSVLGPARPACSSRPTSTPAPSWRGWCRPGRSRRRARPTWP